LHRLNGYISNAEFVEAIERVIGDVCKGEKRKRYIVISDIGWWPGRLDCCDLCGQGKASYGGCG